MASISALLILLSPALASAFAAAELHTELLQYRLQLEASSAGRLATTLQEAKSKSEAALAKSSPSPTWEEAKARAEATVAHLTEPELHLLLRGEHYGVTGPDTEYYVGNVQGISRLGIPALKMQDAGNGFRNTEKDSEGTSTAWPCMLALSSTWDDDLVNLVARAIGNEFKGKGANVLLGPSINVHRVAAGGRNFEYLSGEDPYLGARLTRAYVTGVQAQGVMAVAKHYAFNEQETHRMFQDSLVDDRTKQELYYPPFKAAVQADVGSIMCAYNKVNGSYACHNSEILKKDLRQDMGFKGFVMSDWTAMHHADALQAGLDQEQPGIVLVPLLGDVVTVLSNSTLEKRLDKAVKDAAAVHILTAMYRHGLDKLPGCSPPACHAELFSDQTNLTTQNVHHHSLALRAASSAVTLLKNEKDVLPLGKSSQASKIAVLGFAASSPQLPYFVGGGSGYVKPDGTAKTPEVAIKERAEKDGIQVLTPSASEAKSNFTEEVALAEEADVVVVVAGTKASEGSDRNSLSLSDNADKLIEAVASKKPTVVLMQTPGAVLMPWRNKVKGIANLFMGGVATGEAWANFLFGDTPPRGRLPIMMPATEEDVIAPGQDEAVEYSEGLFTSYRSPRLKSAFPFGHGLSFTNFRYSNAKEVAHCPRRAACVSLTVSNAGRAAGEELVQAYVHFPSPTGGDDSWVKGTPDLLLKGYKRTKVLQPKESETLEFVFSSDDLSLYSPTSGWVPQQKAEIRLGASSEDIRQSVKVELA